MRHRTDPQIRVRNGDPVSLQGWRPGKGLWDELLGVGQFYNDLSVQAPGSQGARATRGAMASADEGLEEFSVGG